MRMYVYMDPLSNYSTYIRVMYNDVWDERLIALSALILKILFVVNELKKNIYIQNYVTRKMVKHWGEKNLILLYFTLPYTYRTHAHTTFHHRTKQTEKANFWCQ